MRFREGQHGHQMQHFDTCERVPMESFNVVRDWCVENFGAATFSGHDRVGSPHWKLRYTKFFTHDTNLNIHLAVHDKDHAFAFKMRWC